MGLGYTKGLQRQVGDALVAQRARPERFTPAEDLALRLTLLKRKEITLLARVGAPNGPNGIAHRRDALWEVERAGKSEGSLITQRSELLADTRSKFCLSKACCRTRMALCI